MTYSLDCTYLYTSDLTHAKTALNKVNVALKISVVSEMLLYSDLLTLHNNTLNSTWHPSKTNSVNLTRCETAPTPTQRRVLIGCEQTQNPPPRINDCTNSQSIKTRPTKLG